MKTHHKIFSGFLVIAIACTFGCGSSPEKTIVGKWEIDKDALKEQMEKDKDNPGAAFGAAMLESMNMTFEFKSDGKLVLAISMMGQSDEKEGTWKVKSTDGNTMKVDMTSPEGKPETITVKVIDNNTIEMSGGGASMGKMPGGDTLKLKRAK